MIQSLLIFVLILPLREWFDYLAGRRDEFKFTYPPNWIQFLLRVRFFLNSINFSFLGVLNLLFLVHENNTSIN